MFNDTILDQSETPILEREGLGSNMVRSSIYSIDINLAKIVTIFAKIFKIWKKTTDSKVFLINSFNRQLVLTEDPVGVLSLSHHHLTYFFYAFLCFSMFRSPRDKSPRDRSPRGRFSHDKSPVRRSRSPDNRRSFDEDDK